MLFKTIQIVKFPSWLLFFLLVFPFIMAGNIPYGISLAGIVMIIWMFLVGSTLKEKSINELGYSMKWFNAALLYTICYIIIGDVFFKNQVSSVLIPFHLIAVISIFWALFYLSKLLVTAEDKKNVSNRRCIGTFFLFWFFPIGIWFIHPRIKRIVHGNVA